MQNETATPTLGFLLADTARLMRKRFDQKAKALGLTRAQWQMLATLARNEGTNQAGLAELLDVEPITLGRLVDRMEERGWVERRADPADRRVRRLFMTDQARPVIADMRRLADEVYGEAMEGMGPDAKSQLMSHLAQLRANLSDRARPSERIAG